jgi:hypothetical protein
MTTVMMSLAFSKRPVPAFLLSVAFGFLFVFGGVLGGILVFHMVQRDTLGI